MIRIEVHRSGVSRTLVLVRLFAIGLIASTAIPALGSSNTWTPTGSMTTARTGHTATLLTNGEVLVAGGGNATGSLTSTELYNPATGKYLCSKNILENDHGVLSQTQVSMSTSAGEET